MYLARNTENSGSATMNLGFNWQASNDYFFRIQGTGNPPQYTEISGISITAVPRTLEIISPKTGTRWKAGSKVSILWVSTNLKSCKIDIVYSTPDMKIPKIIKLAKKNDGQTSWNIPKDVHARDDYSLSLYCAAADLVTQSDVITISAAKSVDGISTNLTVDWVYAFIGFLAGLICIALQVFLYFRYIKSPDKEMGNLDMSQTQSLQEKLLKPEATPGNIS